MRGCTSTHWALLFPVRRHLLHRVPILQEAIPSPGGCEQTGDLHRAGAIGTRGSRSRFIGHHPAPSPAGPAPGRALGRLRGPTVLGAGPGILIAKAPFGGGLQNLGRLMGLEPTTPGITRKVSKLLELVVVRVCGGACGVAPHIHHKILLPRGLTCRGSLRSRKKTRHPETPRLPYQHGPVCNRAPGSG